MIMINEGAMIFKYVIITIIAIDYDINKLK